MITLFFTVAFCLGWRIITDEGNLLYFIRKPFENIPDQLELNEELYLSVKNPVVKNRIKILKLKLYFAKPFILCITCFSSIWGTVVYIALNGIDLNHVPHLIINCISAAFIQTYIWIKFEKLKQN
jgi:hypothetical protein